MLLHVFHKSICNFIKKKKKSLMLNSALIMFSPGLNLYTLHKVLAFFIGPKDPPALHHKLIDISQLSI